jgi:hypothetical protein
MMKERSKPTTKENHTDMDTRTSARTLNEEEKSMKSADPLELLEKRLAKLSGGLVSATSASDQDRSTDITDTSEESSAWSSEAKESAKDTKLTLLVSHSMFYFFHSWKTHFGNFDILTISQRFFLTEAYRRKP